MSSEHEFYVQHSGLYVRAACDCGWASDSWRYGPGITTDGLLHSDQTTHDHELTG